MTTKVGIIGSAGRREDAKKMTKAIFSAMVNKAEEVITQHFKLDLKRVHLVSGGAAWADHIAVVHYCHEVVFGHNMSGLTLHFPAQWHNEPTPHFHDNEKTNLRMNPGRSANKLHKQFSEKIGEDSLDQIKTCITHLGGKYKVHDGFKERNSAIARESAYLIAFTWNDGTIPKKSSGTFDTWQKHKGRKIHIPISGLVSVKDSVLLGSASSKVDYPSPSGETVSCESSEEKWEDPKLLEHQSSSLDSGFCSGDSQPLSSLESSSWSSCEGETSTEPDYRADEKVTVGTKRKDTFDQSEDSKRPRVNTS